MFGVPQRIVTGFASWLRYCSDVDERKPTKLCMMFGRLLGWYTANSPLSPSISTPSLSLPPQDLPLSQTFLTIDSLPASGLTPLTSRPDRFFSAAPFFGFSFFIIRFVRFRAAVKAGYSSAFRRTLIYSVVSYRIVHYIHFRGLLMPTNGRRCSNEAKTLKRLKFAWVSQTCQSISQPLVDRSSLYCEDMTCGVDIAA